MLKLKKIFDRLIFQKNETFLKKKKIVEEKWGQKIFKLKI